MSPPCTNCEHPKYHHHNMWKRILWMFHIERIGAGECSHDHCHCTAGSY